MYLYIIEYILIYKVINHKLVHHNYDHKLFDILGEKSAADSGSWPSVNDSFLNLPRTEKCCNDLEYRYQFGV